MKISFHHINLVSKNLEELNNFYKNILKLDSLPEQQFPRTEANQNKGYDGKIKFVTDSWKFTKNINNKSPNWYLSEIISQ